MEQETTSPTREEAQEAQETTAETPQDANTDDATALTDDKSQMSEKDAAARKQKLLQRLYAGFGKGEKKKQSVDAFWRVVWPGLEKEGWHKVGTVARFLHG